jgi:glucoamylase
MIERYAPGFPGSPPRWTSSAKSAVGASLSTSSRVCFTISHGILNEVYYPKVDQACIRDLGLIVTDGASFFSEEKRDARSVVRSLADGVPAFHLENTCREGRYRIDKEIVADPRRDVVLQRIRFVALNGARSNYRLYALLAPHLGNRGDGNTAWIGDLKGVPMLFAERDMFALALACSVPWAMRSAGFVGTSDGWGELQRNKRLSVSYERAENGNVALIGEIALDAGTEGFVLALGFGRHANEAGHAALSSLQGGFDAAQSAYENEWRAWQDSLSCPVVHEPREGLGRDRNLRRTSTAVLRTHEDKGFPGGSVASLSIPWGMAKGDGDLGGYHLVWPRDLVEVGGGLLAAGARADAMRILAYLRATQEADGHWPQNMWLDGSAGWTNLQLDETALPILLVALAAREGVAPAEVAPFWPMVRRAASFLVQNGPMSPQDRWEEAAGHSPFTLAAEIAALIVAAEMADANGEPAAATYLRETADAWNADIERWLYVTDTELGRRIGVEGYYVRIAPPGCAAGPRFLALRNKPAGEAPSAVSAIVSADALALVRFGLRAPDDPRILNTVKVIDALLKVETPNGPAWRRYNEDGYGETVDGGPFDGIGIGRPWPLLTGERGHYELAAGRAEEAERLVRALEAFANDGGLIPEQVWDGPDVPDADLTIGGPTGSAMPLAWAHAEHLKLRRSIDDGVVFDMPPQVVAHFSTAPPAPHATWRFEHLCHCVALGKTLRIELHAAARVHWGVDGWREIRDVATRDTGLGMHIIDLPTEHLADGAVVHLTFYWPEAQRWEGRDFEVLFGGGRASARHARPQGKGPLQRS